MKILDPQSATLTNIEVLAHLTANPPRRSPNPPTNSGNFAPKPDLRDHNTVVKEIHNYVSRLSPHLYNYPKYTHDDPQSEEVAPVATTTTQPSSQQRNPPQGDDRKHLPGRQEELQQLPRLQSSVPTDLDVAIREVITRLKPFGLTKAEVIMIINLGVAVGGTENLERGDEEEGDAEAEGGKDVDENGETVDGDGDVAMGADNGANTHVAGEGGEEALVEGEEEAAEGAEEDYGAMVLLDTVIEDREDRLSNEDIGEILKILKETLGRKKVRGSQEGKAEEDVV